MKKQRLKTSVNENDNNGNQWFWLVDIVIIKLTEAE